MNVQSGFAGASQHAAVRAQQRGIPPLIVQWLIAYGEEQPDNKGARVVYFTKRSRKRIARENGDMVVRRLHDFLNAYAVIASDGQLITCGHRVKKINRT